MRLQIFTDIWPIPPSRLDFFDDFPLDCESERVAARGWLLGERCTLMKRTGLLLLSAAVLALAVQPALADGNSGAKKKSRVARTAKATHAAADSSIRVQIDYSKLVQLKGTPTTAVIGNPAIADVQLLEGGVLFIQGRGYGTTNLIILDGAGKTVMNTTVVVTPPEGGTVAMYRGSNVNNYACSPRCVRYPMPGETQEAYTGASSSYESYSQRAMSPGNK